VSIKALFYWGMFMKIDWNDVATKIVAGAAVGTGAALLWLAMWGFNVEQRLNSIEQTGNDLSLQLSHALTKLDKLQCTVQHNCEYELGRSE
jgi:hypothetical protein